MVIAAEDDAVGSHLIDEVEQLAFTADRRVIDPREEWEPSGDAVVVCGPASAHIGNALMSEDQVLGMTIADGGRWYIVNKTTGERFSSPMDDPEPRRACVAYLARHVRDGQVITHIAGIHALGSIGAAHYLTEHLAELYAAHPEESFSMAVAAEFDGLAPKSIDVLVPPRAWA
ncbi:hypothetical protein ACFQV8_37065 [Pseudonocardia benzenivorans]